MQIIDKIKKKTAFDGIETPLTKTWRPLKISHIIRWKSPSSKMFGKSAYWRKNIYDKKLADIGHVVRFPQEKACVLCLGN